MSWTRCRSLALLLCGAVIFAHIAPRTAIAQDLARGEELFDLCAQCHAADGGGNRLFLAPAISGMAEWALLAQLKKFRDGQRGTHFDDISGMRMRPMALTLRSDEDVAAVAAYVASLPDTNPEPEH